MATRPNLEQEACGAEVIKPVFEAELALLEDPDYAAELMGKARMLGDMAKGG